MSISKYFSRFLCGRNDAVIVNIDSVKEVKSPVNERPIEVKVDVEMAPLEEVIVAVEKEILPLDYGTMDDSIFMDAEHYDIKLLKYMTRRDYRLLRRYRELCVMLQDLKIRKEDMNQRLYEARRDTTEEDHFLRIGWSVLPIDKNIAETRQFSDQLAFLETRERMERCTILEKHFNLLTNKYKKCMKESIKIIVHFKEKHFNEMSYERLAASREPNPENNIDLDYLEHRLPPEMVDIIGSYLTYETRLNTLEDSCFFRYLYKLNVKRSAQYLNYLTKMPNYYSVNMDDLIANTIYNQSYPGGSNKKTTVKERQQRVAYIYYKYRHHDQKTALKIVKEFPILFGEEC
jgi:hypothetical protein